MSEQPAPSSVTRFLVGLAAFVVIIAGMRAASALVVPFLLSAFLAVISASPLFWLQRRGVPTWVSLSIVIVVITGVALSAAAVIGTSVASFTQDIPSLQAGLQEKMHGVLVFLERTGIDVPEDAVTRFFNPSVAVGVVGNVFSALSGVLSNAFLILLTVIFILLESSGIVGKIRELSDDPDASMMQFEAITENIKRYVGIKTVTSAATGIFIAIWLSVIGVNYAPLWGLLAFLLNYVPNIGSIIAAIPAILLALVQAGGGTALLTAGGFLAVNLVIGNAIEPRFMGRGLGLSTLVVFVSLLFWGWVLGPVGMLLAAPLTMAIKIGLERNEGTKAVGILLGPATAPVLEAEAEE